jgi:hypothetical protein
MDVSVRVLCVRVSAASEVAAECGERDAAGVEREWRLRRK